MGDSDEELDGDFEDMETGEKHQGTAGAEPKDDSENEGDEDEMPVHKGGCVLISMLGVCTACARLCVRVQRGRESSRELCRAVEFEQKCFVIPFVVQKDRRNTHWLFCAGFHFM